jgi:hypothetical protein
MARVPPLTRLARWLIALGLIVVLSAFVYPFLVRNAVDAQSAIVADLHERLRLLEGIRDDMRTAKDSATIEVEIASTQTALARVEQRMQRRQNELRGLWKLNGRGPMLLVAGLLFVGIGVRLHRFVQYGE